MAISGVDNYLIYLISYVFVRIQCVCDAYGLFLFDNEYVHL
jgi:hypothetical protein